MLKYQQTEQCGGDIKLKQLKYVLMFLCASVQVCVCSVLHMYRRTLTSWLLGTVSDERKLFLHCHHVNWPWSHLMSEYLLNCKNNIIGRELHRTDDWALNHCRIAASGGKTQGCCTLSAFSFTSTFNKFPIIFIQNNN